MRIIVVSGKVYGQTLRAKLRPLSINKKVKEIHVVSKVSDVKINKVTYHKVPPLFSFFPVLYFLASSFMVLRLCKSKKIELILSYHIILSSFIAAFCSMITKTPYNVSQTGGLIEKQMDGNQIINNLVLRLIKGSIFMNVPGEHSKKFFTNKGINEDKIYTIHSSIDTNVFYPLKCEKYFDIIFVGTLQRRKNVDILVEAIRLLNKENYIVKCAIVGDGEERNNLEILTSKYNLENQIFFWGYRKHVEVLLNGSKILYICSSIEGLPTAMKEGMACGIPPIASNVFNNTTLAKNNFNSLVLEEINPENVAKAIIKLLDNPKFYSNLSQNCLKTITIEHSDSVLSNKWTNVLGDHFKN